MSHINFGSAALMAGLFMAGLATSSGRAEAASDPLAHLVWKARPVVVLADEPNDADYRHQMEALDARAKALAGYDIKIVAMTEPAGALRRKLGLPRKGFAVALVGKDGSVKETWTHPVDPNRILALIDVMPMRRDELRRMK